jgi:hypothetical protein
MIVQRIFRAGLKPIMRISAAALIALLLTSGCKKKPEATAETPADASQSAPAAAAAAAPAVPDPPPLAGVAEIKAALGRKDYAAAVAGLNQAKAGMVAGQELQYNQISRQVRQALAEAAPSNPAAAEAMQALGIMQRGR